MAKTGHITGRHKAVSGLIWKMCISIPQGEKPWGGRGKVLLYSGAIRETKSFILLPHSPTLLHPQLLPCVSTWLGLSASRAVSHPPACFTQPLLCVFTGRRLQQLLETSRHQALCAGCFVLLLSIKFMLSFFGLELLPLLVCLFFFP